METGERAAMMREASPKPSTSETPSVCQVLP